jgi:hypothetical protein
MLRLDLETLVIAALIILLEQGTYTVSQLRIMLALAQHNPRVAAALKEKCNANRN